MGNGRLLHIRGVRVAKGQRWQKWQLGGPDLVEKLGGLAELRFEKNDAFKKSCKFFFD